MKLLIRNLARTISEEELEALFAPYGEVAECNLVMDEETGGSKGFGFVEMPGPGNAKAAMKSLNASEISGQVIRVKRAVEK
ncbi:MAG: RNA-binding protein [Oleispira sp.]|jgi:RNA recognition motif-containing protein|nr:RNA-binding protein [Oleispira sp.]